MEKINKLSLSATILIGCVILGGFYYISQISKQNSIEKQQQIELKAKADQAQILLEREDEIISQKAECAKDAEGVAVNAYCKEVGCSKTESFTGKYFTKDYDSAYSRCLERIGLK